MWFLPVDWWSCSCLLHSRIGYSLSCNRPLWLVLIYLHDATVWSISHLYPFFDPILQLVSTNTNTPGNSSAPTSIPILMEIGRCGFHQVNYCAILNNTSVVGSKTLAAHPATRRISKGPKRERGTHTVHREEKSQRPHKRDCRDCH